MTEHTPAKFFSDILRSNAPKAAAWIKGNEDNPQLSGIVRFFATPYGGCLVEAELFGLPNIAIAGSSNFYGMHIHENGDCTQPFERTGEHYSKEDAPHPQHTGDMPPLMGNQGYAWQAFYDKRFVIPDIVGRSVVIHAMADDFVTQPAGNSGAKIGCGVIREL
ncbi:MAG: superoxide dismutase family protein [Roseburia sp.]|nr:superoxide dismutase family protein [Roseburia sp.]